MTFGTVTSLQIDGEKVETVADLIFWFSSFQSLRCVRLFATP